MNFEISGYTATPALYQMLCLHMLGTYSSQAKNIAALKEIGVINDDGWIVELSEYFEQKIESGYFSDDYFEFQNLTITANSEAEALAQVKNTAWIYGPTIE